MNLRGRVACIGSAASEGNTSVPTVAPVVQGAMIMKQLRMEGFVISRFRDRWNEGVTQMVTKKLNSSPNLCSKSKWQNEGKIVAEENIIKGFEKVPTAFISLFTGKGGKGGKLVVKVN